MTIEVSLAYIVIELGILELSKPCFFGGISWQIKPITTDLGPFWPFFVVIANFSDFVRTSRTVPGEVLSNLPRHLPTAQFFRAWQNLGNFLATQGSVSSSGNASGRPSP